MPFDADLPIAFTVAAPANPFNAADPSPELAAADPARLLAFLYASPRPCAALDALLGAEV
jgi:hypothetical protein